MVVVSGNWMRNVAYPIDMVIENKMTARAVFICRPNSHPFQERTLTLDQPIKVGRSVARAKATPTNAIFDCKVLSRHHALLWYEHGKFYLQDTKSSNGTFVNNQRLAAETEQHEVNSGDIVQFGVDVIENNKKVTHGCIIATLKLYLPDGKEAKASPIIVENSSHVVPLDELYKLHQIIVEASQREQILETKLAALQSAVDSARASAEDSWQAYVGEERLLSHVSALETQLQQHSKNWGEDKYREENARLQEEINVYQAAAKEALEKLHAERLEALAKAAEQERCRITTEQEMLLTREHIADLQRELEELAKKLTEEQLRANEERTRLDRQQWELQAQLNFEKERNEDLHNALKCANGSDNSSLCHMDLSIFERNDINDDVIKTNKPDLATYKSLFSDEFLKSNGDESEPNHLNLTFAPVASTDSEVSEDSVIKSAEDEGVEKETSEMKEDSPSEAEHTRSAVDGETKLESHEKHVTFAVDQESGGTLEDGTVVVANKSDTSNETDDLIGVDTKTLKYRYQAAQNELKRRIESLESLLKSNEVHSAKLEKSLDSERELNRNHEDEAMALSRQLSQLTDELRERSEENCRLHETIAGLAVKSSEPSGEVISSKMVSIEQLVSVEEELVLLKERYAQLGEEKLKLQHELNGTKQRYNQMCNSSYDKLYFYIAPLVLIIFYLVISATIS